MKNFCTCFFRDRLEVQIQKAIKESKTTDPKAYKQLVLDARSISNLEKSSSFCCTLMFIAYICFCCTDVPGLIRELRPIFLLYLHNDRGT